MPAGESIIRRGPYRFIRHPMCSAALLFVWAGIASHASAFTLVVGIALTGVAIARVIAEERLLRAKYPDYSSYAQTTKALVPYLLWDNQEETIQRTVRSRQGINWDAATVPKEETSMIVVRNVFQLKFGKAREAVALVKQGIVAQQKALAGVDYSTRVLTDVTGPFYTLVLEGTFPSLAAYEENLPKAMADKDFQAIYRQVAELVDSGHREIFTVVG